MKPIQRLDQFRRLKKLSITDFEKSIGYSKNGFSNALHRGSSLRDETITLIVEKYPELNLIWLFTGLGQLIVGESNEQEITSFNEPNLFAVYELIEQLDPKNEKVNVTNQLKKELIRLYSNHMELKNELFQIKKLSDEI